MPNPGFPTWNFSITHHFTHTTESTSLNQHHWIYFTSSTRPLPTYTRHHPPQENVYPLPILSSTIYWYANPSRCGPRKHGPRERHTRIWSRVSGRTKSYWNIQYLDLWAVQYCNHEGSRRRQQRSDSKRQWTPYFIYFVVHSSGSGSHEGVLGGSLSTTKSSGALHLGWWKRSRVSVKMGFSFLLAHGREIWSEWSLEELCLKLGHIALDPSKL